MRLCLPILNKSDVPFTKLCSFSYILIVFVIKISKFQNLLSNIILFIAFKDSSFLTLTVMMPFYLCIQQTYFLMYEVDIYYNNSTVIRSVFWMNRNLPTSNWIWSLIRIDALVFDKVIAKSWKNSIARTPEERFSPKNNQHNYKSCIIKSKIL